MYLGLADILVVAHGLMICCVVAGTGAAVAGRLRKGALTRAYIALLLAVLVSQGLDGECVLTGWEQALRNMAVAGSAYRGSYIGHYLPIIDPVASWIGPAIIAAGILAVPAWWIIDRWNMRRVRRSR